MKGRRENEHNQARKVSLLIRGRTLGEKEIIRDNKSVAYVFLLWKEKTSRCTIKISQNTAWIKVRATERCKDSV